MMAIPGHGPIRVSTLASSYIVNPTSYADSVYPVDVKQPTKVITETHEETKQVPHTKIEKKINGTMAIIFGALAGVCLIIAVAALIMCLKKEESALDRNNEAADGLI